MTPQLISRAHHFVKKAAAGRKTWKCDVVSNAIWWRFFQITFCTIHFKKHLIFCFGGRTRGFRHALWYLFTSRGRADGGRGVYPVRDKPRYIKIDGGTREKIAEHLHGDGVAYWLALKLHGIHSDLPDTAHVRYTPPPPVLRIDGLPMTRGATARNTPAKLMINKSALIGKQRIIWGSRVYREVELYDGSIRTCCAKCIPESRKGVCRKVTQRPTALQVNIWMPLLASNLRFWQKKVLLGYQTKFWTFV